MIIDMKRLTGEIMSNCSLKERSEISGIIQEAFTAFLFCLPQTYPGGFYYYYYYYYYYKNSMGFAHPYPSIVEQDMLWL
jgi:hypothetical protein